MKDYWAVLGVRRGASLDEIRRAYRRLAWRYHPDRNRDDPAAEARMREVNEAYEVLSDPDRCARYELEWQEAQWLAASRRYAGGRSRVWSTPEGSNAPYGWDLASMIWWLTGGTRPSAKWPFDGPTAEDFLWETRRRSSASYGLMSALIEMLLMYRRARSSGW